MVNLIQTKVQCVRMIHLRCRLRHRLETATYLVRPNLNQARPEIPARREARRIATVVWSTCCRPAKAIPGPYQPVGLSKDWLQIRLTGSYFSSFSTNSYGYYSQMSW